MRINDSKHFRAVAPDDRAILPPMGPIHVVRVPESLRRKRSAGKAKVHGEAHCRMCLRPREIRPLTRHHLVPQQWFMVQAEIVRDLRNCDACIVPLCRPCHDSVEGKKNRDGRKMLRRVLTQDEIAFCIAVRGKEWFDKAYPV